MARDERRRVLHDALLDLRRYRDTFDEATFLSSRDAQRMVLQALYVGVQSCVDEALEQCKANGIDPGSTYRAAFLALGAAGVLEPGLAARMANWASFRNVLAHFYPVVDLRKVYAALGDLDDLERFARWLDSLAV